MKDVSISRQIGYLFALALALISIVFLSLLSGCAKADFRPPIVFHPVNPDVASVSTIVKRSEASNAKASEAATRAVQIVERIIVAPGQELELERLKLELSTTIDNLKLTTESLFEARGQIGELTLQIDDVKAWGIEQQKTAQGLYESVKSEQSRADAEGKKAFRNGRERDVFVLLFSIAGTVAAVNFFRSFLWKLTPMWGALAMAGVALGSFVACFTVVRFIVGAVVRLTT